LSVKVWEKVSEAFGTV